MKKDRPTIEDLLEFVNRYSTEPNLMWSVPHLYELKISYDIQWIFDKHTQRNFYFKSTTEDIWKNTTSEDLVKLMVQEKADLNYFELQLLKIICVQAVCSHYYIERAGDLIGKDKIEQAIDLIMQVTDGLLDEEEAKKEESVEEPKPKKKSKITKLKAVKKSTDE